MYLTGSYMYDVFDCSITLHVYMQLPAPSSEGHDLFRPTLLGQRDWLWYWINDFKLEHGSHDRKAEIRGEIC